jgi:spore coat protein U-like protein
MLHPIALQSISAMNRLVVRRSFLSALTAAAIFTSTLPASQAGTLTTTFAVSATIPGAACTGISATALAFGTVPATSTASSTSTVTVNCVNGTAYSIAAVGTVPGCYTNGTLTVYNVMTSPSNPTIIVDTPGYILFRDSAHQLPLLTGSSCGTPGTAITGTGTGSAQTQTIYGLVYGSIPGTGQTGAPGSYTDTATVTLTF